MWYNIHIAGLEIEKKYGLPIYLFLVGDINFSLPFLFLISQNSQVSYIVVRVKINIFMYMCYFYALLNWYLTTVNLAVKYLSLT